MPTITMNDFTGDPEALVNAQLAACDRVFRSGRWILGKEVSAFEREWSEWLRVPLAIGCGNGLDAIEIGLRALKIGPGDEVITTAMTAFATVLAVIRAGATPILADIDMHTAMLCPESVKRCIGARSKAILLVHLYGQIGPVSELRDMAVDNGLALIEDCAQAHGATFRETSAGGFGNFAAWSFYPTKNLGAVGDGGALTTASTNLAQEARALRNYGQSVRYHHPVLGMNSRLDEIQAALLRERLHYLQTWVGRRREIAHRYTMRIANDAVRLMPLPIEPARHAHHLFVVNSRHRDDLQRHLESESVESLIHYPIPVHQQEPCLNTGRDPRGLPRTEEHARSCLSLPCHPGLTDIQTDSVIAAVNRFRI